MNSSGRANPETSDAGSEFPTAGRLAAVDFGTVRIGIAVCDPDRILASPLEVYQVRSQPRDAIYFSELAKTERLAGFVVGLPIHCDGGESQTSRECRQFARWLSETTNLPVRLFDERFSTAAAKERLGTGRPGGAKKTSRAKQKKQLDAVAALVLLESFLEACRYRGAPVGHPTDEQSSSGHPVAGQSIDELPRGDASLE